MKKFKRVASALFFSLCALGFAIEGLALGKAAFGSGACACCRAWYVVGAFFLTVFAAGCMANAIAPPAADRAEGEPNR